MGSPSQKKTVRNLGRLLLSFFVVATAGCSTLSPLQVDPCAVTPLFDTCHAVPLNQPGIEPYDRVIEKGDICFTPEDYARIQKSYRQLVRQCGGTK